MKEAQPVLMTVCILQRGNELYFPRKLTGLGVGYYVALGGKVKDGETPAQANAREVWEESGEQVRLVRTWPCGVAWCTFQESGGSVELWYFWSNEFSGEPIASREAEPHWFSSDALPLSEMWADDRHVLPCILRGERVIGRFIFDNPDSRELLRYEVRILNSEALPAPGLITKLF